MDWAQKKDKTLEILQSVSARLLTSLKKQKWNDVERDFQERDRLIKELVRCDKNLTPFEDLDRGLKWEAQLREIKLMDQRMLKTLSQGKEEIFKSYKGLIEERVKMLEEEDLPIKGLQLEVKG